MWYEAQSTVHPMNERAAEFIVTLITKDNISLRVSREVASQSIVIKSLIEDLSEEDASDFDVPLPDVDAATLHLIINYAEHHKSDIPKVDGELNVERSHLNHDPLKYWDRSFLRSLTAKQLHDLVIAANYLNIRPLTDVTCKFIADMVKGKSAEEIKNIYKMDERTDLEIYHDTRSEAAQTQRLRDQKARQEM